MFNPEQRLIDLVDEMHPLIHGKKVTEELIIAIGYYEMEFKDICDDLPDLKHLKKCFKVEKIKK